MDLKKFFGILRQEVKKSGIGTAQTKQARLAKRETRFRAARQKERNFIRDMKVKELIEERRRSKLLATQPEEERDAT